MPIFISSLVFLLSAISFLYGLNTWRREFLGKRKLELLENVLSQFYEAQDAISHIRSPFSLMGEGITRNPGAHETEEEKRTWNRAYIPFERHEKYEKLFADLRSQKYRMMALFGTDYSDPFDGIKRLTNSILIAASQLGSRYWVTRLEPQDAEGNRQYHELRKEYENTIWGQPGDDFEVQVSTYIEKIENLSRTQTIQIETSKVDEAAKKIIIYFKNLIGKN